MKGRLLESLGVVMMLATLAALLQFSDEVPHQALLAAS